MYFKKQLRKIKTTINEYLKQGMTPEKLALSIVLGISFGLFPLVGITTFLCLAVSISLRLNLVFIQLVNYSVYPLQLILFLPWLKLGNVVFSFSAIEKVSPSLIKTLLNSNLQLILTEFGLLFLSAVLLWFIISVPFSLLLYTLLLKHFRKLQTKFGF
jgi:uncharacterized protein (DUF2062 family)